MRKACMGLPQLAAGIDPCKRVGQPSARARARIELTTLRVVHFRTGLHVHVGCTVYCIVDCPIQISFATVKSRPVIGKKILCR